MLYPYIVKQANEIKLRILQCVISWVLLENKTHLLDKDRMASIEKENFFNRRHALT